MRHEPRIGAAQKIRKITVSSTLPAASAVKDLKISKMASTFGTVLVARSKDQPATPLEQSLRTCSQRLRVVPRLSGEAHFIVKEEGSSLAVQLFDAARIEETERRWKEAGEGGGGGDNRVPGEDWMLTKKAAGPVVAGKSRGSSNSSNRFNPLKDDATILGTQTFRDTFRNTAIFFVLGPPHSDLRRRQMTRPTSFLNVMQRALASPRTGSAAGSTGSENGGINHNSTKTNDDNNNATATTSMGSSRIFLVTDVASLQSHLRTTIDSIRPDKTKMKEKFFAEQCRLNLLPPPPSSASASSSSVAEVDNTVVAQRVADALRAWSDGVGIPRGEMDVVMGMLGSLEAIVTADGGSLANVPVSDRTKQMIVAFFSSSPPALGGDGGGEEQRDDNGMLEEMQQQQVDQHNIAVAGGWTAGDRDGSGMGFSGGVAAGINGGDGAIPGMQSVGGFQPFSNSPMANYIGNAEGPRQFQVHGDYARQGNGGGAAGYYNSNAWGGGQQPPSFSGSNFGPRGW